MAPEAHHIPRRRRTRACRPPRCRGRARTWAAALAGALLAGALALVGGAAGTPPPAAAATRASAAARPPGVLLALGDSLAAGYQPTDGHRLPPVDPATGLPDEGYPGGYARDVAGRERLRLVDLACPGETTASFSGTPAQAACRSLYETMLRRPSQLAAALAYLAAHRGAVRLLTIDLGANDVDACVSASRLDLACVAGHAAAARLRLRRDLPRLLAALHADDPGARAVGLTYYDPFLGLAYDPGGTRGLALATVSLGGLDAFDAVLAKTFRASGLAVANVAGAFATGSLLPLARFRGVPLPHDADVVCRLTWMCPAPARHASPDIHPDTAGYARIATAVEAALRH